MRLTHLGAALIAIGALLAAAPSARAQNGAYPSPGLTAGAGAGAQVSISCGDRSTAPEPSAYATGRLDCSPAANLGSRSSTPPCRGPYRGYSGLLYSEHSAFHAPGGEAYSYAGYGSSYSPYATSAGASLPADSAGVESPAATTRPAACTSPADSTPTAASQTPRLSRADLGSLALPGPTDIQRSSDLREPNDWLIRTRDGPIVQRVAPDGQRAFTAAAQAGGNGATVWRPWGELDRPAVDYAWQNFAIWWTDQGRPWPPS
jgi:hypothetical protein